MIMMMMLNNDNNNPVSFCIYPLYYVHQLNRVKLLLESSLMMMMMVISLHLFLHPDYHSC